MSAILVPVICWIARRGTVVQPAPAGPMLLPVVLGMTIGLGAAALLIRGRITPRAPEEAMDRWWLAQLPRAVAVWAAAEGMSLAGGLVAYLSGRPAPLAAGVLGLSLLYATRPARLEEA